MRMFLLEVKRVLKTRTTWILLILSLLLTLLLAYIPTTFHSYSWTEADGQNTDLKGMELIQYKHPVRLECKPICYIPQLALSFCI